MPDNPEVSAQPAVESLLSKFQLIQITKVKPSRHQARKDFSEEALKGLAESMKQEGLQNPITVRQVGDEFELVAGERRLRAAKLLGWTAIEAKIIQTVSEAESAAKGLLENLQREDLNPIEEAEGFAELNQLDSGFWTQEQIAKVTGRTQTYISRSIALLGLPEPIIQNMRARIFSRSHGLEFIRLQTQETQLEAFKEVSDKKLNWEATRKLVDQMLENKAGKPETSDHSGIQPPTPFKFTRKGHQVTMTGTFSDASNLDGFFLEFKTAYLAWTEKRTTPITDHVPLITPSIRLAESPEEEAELEQLAVGSPSLVPVYAWVYGEDSPVTKSVAKATWNDVNPSDPREFIKQFFKRNQ
jgi:ParB family chromosome partitioning protein